MATPLTARDFNRKYHEFKTPDAEVARALAQRINAEGGVDGEPVLVVYFPRVGYGVLLAKAALTILRFMPELAAANPEIPLAPPLDEAGR